MKTSAIPANEVRFSSCHSMTEYICRTLANGRFEIETMFGNIKLSGCFADSNAAIQAWLDTASKPVYFSQHAFPGGRW